MGMTRILVVDYQFCNIVLKHLRDQTRVTNVYSITETLNWRHAILHQEQLDGLFNMRENTKALVALVTLCEDQCSVDSLKKSHKCGNHPHVIKSPSSCTFLTIPYKYAIMCQIRSGIVPMLLASERYRPDSNTLLCIYWTNFILYVCHFLICLQISPFHYHWSIISPVNRSTFSKTNIW